MRIFASQILFGFSGPDSCLFAGVGQFVPGQVVDFEGKKVAGFDQGFQV
jgi:hypothetical protein